MTGMPHLIGGALCLDFVNTVDPRHAPGRRGAVPIRRNITPRLQ